MNNRGDGNKENTEIIRHITAYRCLPPRWTRYITIFTHHFLHNDYTHTSSSIRFAPFPIGFANFQERVEIRFTMRAQEDPIFRDFLFFFSLYASDAWEVLTSAKARKLTSCGIVEPIGDGGILFHSFCYLFSILFLPFCAQKMVFRRPLCPAVGASIIALHHHRDHLALDILGGGYYNRAAVLPRHSHRISFR